MKLAEYLSIPFVIEAESVEVASDTWVRKVTFPEMPDCNVEAEQIEDALDQLERRRIEMTIQLLRDGRRPPIPRRPLQPDAMRWSLERLGLREAVEPLLDDEEADFVRSASGIAGGDN